MVFVANHINTETPDDQPTTVAQALTQAIDLGLDRLDAQLLLLHTLNAASQDSPNPQSPEPLPLRVPGPVPVPVQGPRPALNRAWLLAHDTDPLPAVQVAGFSAMAARRAAGEPLAYLVGQQEFFGLMLNVDARVLIPRPDTETLVTWALDVLVAGNPTVLDLGTGSGAVALAIKHAAPQAQVSATDVSADALAVAQANALQLNLPIDFSQNFWLDQVVGQFDLIVSNPPYIAALDPHLAALAHEPLTALASGNDGLNDLRTLIGQAGTHLRPGGWLLLEHGYDQAGAVRELLRAAGFNRIESRRDLGGHERCSGASWAHNRADNVGIHSC